LDKLISQLIKEFNLKPFQVENTVKLIDDGNTIPFIARYRKEATGELNDQVLRELYERLVYLRNLDARKEEVLRLIDEQGKLTEDIKRDIEKSESITEIDDIYRPFRPKRRTRATIAKAKGLEPLAIIIMLQQPMKNSIEEVAAQYINAEKEVMSAEDALNGAMDIIAEEISDNASYRKAIRDMFLQSGIIKSKAKKDEDSVYRMYYEYSEAVAKVATHRILAINRGEKEEFLQVSLEVPEEQIVGYLKGRVLKSPPAQTTSYVAKAAEDSYQRLIYPSVEREIRNYLTEIAEEQAMKVFAKNLKDLLLQPPVKGKVALGLDPAYRTGCKIAVVDDTGKVLDTTVIFPTPPQNKVEESRRVISDLIARHDVDIIAIGNGTASKESEIFISELLKDIQKKVYYMMVSEAGASVYSASKLGADEFPDYDVAKRSAISIARRLQDPLAELVKIDPKAIGVGQYQHDMNQKRLGETLGGVVEDCVNSVGVDINTASAPLLSYISGINSKTAKNIVEYREANGRFKERRELLKVKNLGDKAFLQCAGFLRIQDGKNVLDNTSVHPESYSAAEKLLKLLGYTMEDVTARNLKELKKQAEAKGLEALAKEIEVGVPTLRDIIIELLKPGRDPRDELPKPVLRTDILDMKDLKPGMELVGTVRNVADFGAFIDIGVHQDGLVHISELCDRFVKKPMDVVSVGDIVKVRVLEVDQNRKRISLTMKGLN